MYKMMIVDDASFMQASIKLMIEKHGFQVIAEAVNGLDAIGKYKESKPDLVTMDITMPEMSGIESLKKIREMDPKANIVMVSAMGQEALIREAVVSGASSFIVKPFKEDKLVEVLQQVVTK